MSNDDIYQEVVTIDLMLTYPNLATLAVSHEIRTPLVSFVKFHSLRLNLRLLFIR